MRGDVGCGGVVGEGDSSLKTKRLREPSFLLYLLCYVTGIIETEITMPVKSLGSQSWWLAAIGALLVGLSATVGPVILWGIDDETQAAFQDIEELKSERLLYWNEHVRMDERVARATHLLAISKQLDEPLHNLVLERASEDATAVISNSFNIIPVEAMSCYTNSPDNEELSRTLQAAQVDQNSCFEWIDGIRSGEASAFGDVANLRTGMLGVFRGKLEEIEEKIRHEQENIRVLRSDRNFWQGLEMFVGLLGLLMIVLKDTPIWKHNIFRQTKDAKVEQEENGTNS